MLERALVWDPAGHLAEAAVAAVADGELALLPSDAVQHAETCPLCAERVGQAALFALEIAEGLDADFALALSAEAEAAHAPGHALALLPQTALARVEAEPPREASSSRPPYARTSSFAPPAPLPVKAVVAALLVALVASAPWLSTLETPSLAEHLAHLAHVLAQAIAATRAPGVAELAWLASGVLGVVGVVVARMARQPGRLIEGMR
ncbi:MAG: hypothetical protein ABW252_12025 [Polyangiales bacterium]